MSKQIRRRFWHRPLRRGLCYTGELHGESTVEFLAERARDAMPALQRRLKDVHPVVSVNPARSTGPALFVGGWALKQLWLFWVAPIIGAALAGIAYKWLGSED